MERKGRVWCGWSRTLVFLPEGSRKFQTTGMEIGQAAQIVESPGGALWMAETTRSVHPGALPANRHHNDEPEIKVGSAGILFDEDGSLWISSVGDGMRRVPFRGSVHGEKLGQCDNAEASRTS